MKKALIVGVSGQDGSYLAELLIKNGYEVHGTSRDAQLNSFNNLHKLGIFNQVKVHSMTPIDFRSVLQTIRQVEPDEIYNLSGQSSVGLSFDQPVETFDSITVGTINLLEAIRFSNNKIKFYNASSSECFGNSDIPAVENTPFIPRSPYAAAKAAAHWIVSNYREAYNIFACSGILFNHESPLRPIRFVTQKIITTAVRIKNGSNEKLKLGNLSVVRDWGWAPEYMIAIHSMMHLEKPQDFVIATGQSFSLSEFVEETFRQLNLDWKDYCVIDENLKRPTDLSISRANPKKAADILNWKAKYTMKDVIRMMIKSSQEIKFS
ncbi:MAG: GDP-mannose 4,6-dehydratase [Ignavibacterium album]|uniref:GDP-mannose 4,6-dehydratase n=1 Tax=Ignavibacterium album TaxID=591197 RepID=UPI0026F0CB95|nr:GDP-mannose 4,6-dehydratase [Ignavibacterium album]MCX8104711.1 GDP-mannose 4,6-dehydratase [Ignavibacterium album]